MLPYFSPLLSIFETVPGSKVLESIEKRIPFLLVAFLELHCRSVGDRDRVKVAKPASVWKLPQNKLVIPTGYRDQGGNISCPPGSIGTRRVD